MTPHRFILWFLLSALAVFMLMAWRARRRRGVFEPGPILDRVFRCGNGKCGQVYTDDADVENSRCPQCGRMNESVRF